MWEAAEQLQAQLLDVQQVLQAPETTVRLVLTPESVVVAEARRAFTQLALYGYRVDGVIANRVFDAGDDPWRAGWAQTQQSSAGGGHRLVRPAADLHRWLSGGRAGRCRGAREPRRDGLRAARTRSQQSESADFLAVRQVGDAFVMTLALPLVDKDSLDLTRVGDDLVVTVSGRRRVLALPSALRRCQVRGAHVEDGRLEIRFRAGPEQFPRVSAAHP